MLSSAWSILSTSLIFFSNTIENYRTFHVKIIIIFIYVKQIVYFEDGFTYLGLFGTSTKMNTSRNYIFYHVDLFRGVRRERKKIKHLIWETLTKVEVFWKRTFFLSLCCNYVVHRICILTHNKHVQDKAFFKFLNGKAPTRNLETKFPQESYSIYMRTLELLSSN